LRAASIPRGAVISALTPGPPPQPRSLPGCGGAALLCTDVVVAIDSARGVDTQGEDDKPDEPGDLQRAVRQQQLLGRLALAPEDQ